MVRWVQPSIVLEADGANRRTILASNGSVVRIIIPRDTDGPATPLSATILRNVGDLEALVSSGEERHCRGMVRVEAYGKWLLRAYDFTKPQLLDDILPRNLEGSVSHDFSEPKNCSEVGL